jgi:hypothetical protein
VVSDVPTAVMLATLGEGGMTDVADEREALGL